MPSSLYFEDVRVGAAWTTEGATVSEHEAMRFAREWDPHPFHLDPEAAASSVFGRLCASGLQTLLLTYRLFTGLRLFDGTTLAGLGMDRLRFVAPLFPGDTIHVRVTVAEALATRKPERGLLKLQLSTHNQDGTLLADMVLPVLVKRRAATERRCSTN